MQDFHIENFKDSLRGISKNWINERLCIFMTWTYVLKISFLPKLVYELRTTSTRISTHFTGGKLSNWFWNSHGKNLVSWKAPCQQKPDMNKSLPAWPEDWETTMTQIAFCWWQIRYLDERNRTASKNSPTYIWSIKNEFIFPLEDTEKDVSSGFIQNSPTWRQAK